MGQEPVNRHERRDPEQVEQASIQGLLDRAGAAAYLGISERYVARLWAERRLTGRKIGKYVRFAVEDLAEFAERNKVESVR